MNDIMNTLVQGDHCDLGRWEIGEILGIHMRGMQRNDKKRIIDFTLKYDTMPSIVFT